MHEIQVTKQEDGQYEVTVKAGRTTTHQVHLSPDVYQQLSGGAVSEEILIERSFEFLLERESNSSILGQFDLPVIGRYFPEYETEIARRL